MEDKMAKLFSCNTSTRSVKSESIGTTKASSSSTSLGKRPRTTTPTVIVIEDDDDFIVVKTKIIIEILIHQINIG